MKNHQKRLKIFIVFFIFQITLGQESLAQTVPDKIPGLTNFSLQELDLSIPSEQKSKLKKENSQLQNPDVPETHEVSATLDGVNHTLILEPHSLRSRNFRLLVKDKDGGICEVVSPPPCTYRGVIENDFDSWVAAAIVDGKLSASIKLSSGAIWHIQPLSSFIKSADASAHVLYRNEDVIPSEGECGVYDMDFRATDQIVNATSNDSMPISTLDGTCPIIKICEIAIDGDFEFYQKNGSSVSTTLLDIETVMNGVAEIYEQQVGIIYTITEVIVRATPEDPYTTTDSGLLLEQFRDQWNNYHTDIHRDIAHLFTGKDIDGSIVGLSYLGAVCNTDDPYGFSSSKFTTFLPSRVALTAHELGHNWDASHCNSIPDCAIMCSNIGGCSGISDQFCSSTISAITSFRNTRPCLSDYIAYGGGCGTAEGPYQIFTAEQFATLQTSPTDWDRHFRLMADIDLSISPLTEHTVIGNQTTPFSGIFDGNGYIISNFSYNLDGPINNIGLFGYVDGTDAVIRKLGLEYPNVFAESGTGVGGLVGNLRNGNIASCYVSGGSVLGNVAVGGLVGNSTGTITNCYATDSVAGSSNLGGLVGHNDGSVEYCYSAGWVTGTTEMDIGGLVGSGNDGTVSESFWDMDTSCQLTSPGGGTGKSTAEMKMESIYASAGWDFSSPIWTINEGVDYPRLFLWHDTLYGGGSGTEADPFIIFTAEQLNNIGANPIDWHRHFKLMADIDLSSYTEEDFNIIGNDAKAFSGRFNGNGYDILYFNYTSETSKVGLFGVVDGSDAEIKNLGLIDINIEAELASEVGALVGELSEGVVSGCYVEVGRVSGKNNIGGLVGMTINGTLSNCSSSCSVLGNGDHVGGLVGLHYMGTVKNCYSTGNVTGSTIAGGLIGYNGSSFFPDSSLISNSYAAGEVTGQSNVGGLVGYNEGTINNCYSTGRIVGTTQVGIGGLVGYNDSGIVSGSFWDMETSEQPTSSGGTGKMTDEMKMKITFIEASWDFLGESDYGTEYIWRLCEDGTDYPKLAWQFISGDFVCPDGVEIIDFSFFASHWLNTNCDESNGCDRTDIDYSGVVDIADLIYFEENWLEGK